MIQWLVGLLLLVPSLALAAAQTAHPLPNPKSGLFPTELNTFLLEDPASRYRLSFGSFVDSGGLPPTSATLTHTVPAVTGIVHGYYTSQPDTDLTYTNTRRTFLFLDSVNSRDPEVSASGGSGCTFSQRATRLVAIECAAGSTLPTPSVSGLVLLARVDTAGGAITSVVDGRFRSPRDEHTLEFHVKDFGAVCDGETDDTDAVQRAIDHAAVTFPKIILCPGPMKVRSITLTRSLSLIGAGSRVTRLTSDEADTPMITCAPDVTDITLRDFGISRTVNAVAGGDGVVCDGNDGFDPHNNLIFEGLSAHNQYRGFVLGACAYCRGLNLISESNNSHGFEFAYGTNNDWDAVQWEIDKPIAQGNLGSGYYGVNAGADNGIGPFLTDAVSYANQGACFNFGGDASHKVHDVFLVRPVASACNTTGIYFDTYGHGHMIVSPWVEFAGNFTGSIGSHLGLTPVVASNAGYGIALINNDRGVAIMGGKIWTNQFSGIQIASGSPSTSVIGTVFKQNGLANDIAANRTGIYVNANDVVISGVTFANPGGQTSYIYFDGNPSRSHVGVNSYHSDIAESAWINLSTATNMTSGAQFLMGGSFHVGAKRPFELKDRDGGANPSKFFRVANGTLEILNHAFAATLFRLGDAGTPAFPSISAAPGGSKAACFDDNGQLFRSSTGSCPP